MLDDARYPNRGGRDLGDAIVVAPIAAGAAGIWLASEAQSFLLLNLTLLWGGASLIYLAGVSRGHFGGKAGPAAAIWLFAAGFLGLFGTVWAYPLLATAAQALGFLFLPLLAKGWATGRTWLVAAGVALVSLAAVAAYIYSSPLF